MNSETTQIQEARQGICLLSGSSGTHMNIVQFGNNPKYFVNILTRRPEIFSSGTIKCETVNSSEVIEAPYNLASSDPAIAAEGCSIFIISAPVFAHEILLKQIRPFLKRGSIIGSVFGQGGYDLIARSVFGPLIEQLDLTIFSLFNIPYTCFTTTPGKIVLLNARKKYIRLGCLPKSKLKRTCALAEDLWQVRTEEVPNLMEMALTPGNQLIHPGRTMGLHENGPIHLFSQPPRFYATMNQLSADNIQALSDDLQKIKKAVLLRFPELELASVFPIKDRIVSQYGNSVKDSSTLLTTFRTNVGYS